MRRERGSNDVKSVVKINKIQINKNKIELAYLNRRLDYNSNTGVLVWNKRSESDFKIDGKRPLEGGYKSWNTKYAGKAAGHLHRDGYIYISIDKKRYKAHRLAWFIYYGFMTENDLDHKNRIRIDNRILNLREVSRQCNLRNAGMLKNNTSGVKGVCFDKANKKWKSQIVVNKKTINLGRFVAIIDAVSARWEGEKFYKFPRCNTSSSAYNYLKDKGFR